MIKPRNAEQAAVGFRWTWIVFGFREYSDVAVCSILHLHPFLFLSFRNHYDKIESSSHPFSTISPPHVIGHGCCATPDSNF